MQQMVALGGMGMNIGLGMGFPYFQHANYNAACQQVRRGFAILFNDVVCYKVRVGLLCFRNGTACARKILATKQTTVHIVHTYQHTCICRKLSGTVAFTIIHVSGHFHSLLMFDLQSITLWYTNKWNNNSAQRHAVI